MKLTSAVFASGADINLWTDTIVQSIDAHTSLKSQTGGAPLHAHNRF